MYFNDSKLVNTVNRVYLSLLEELHKVVSRDNIEGTNTIELDKAGSEIFGDKWGGAKTLDQWVEIQFVPNRFYIMNTITVDSSDPDAGHWLAVYDGKIWDSFHRPLSTIVPTLLNAKPFTELNYLNLQSQLDSELDCGERCLAALELFRKLFLHD